MAAKWFNSLDTNSIVRSWETSRNKLKKHSVTKNCSSDLKNFSNSQPSASNFKSFFQSLEQFFLTVGQKNAIVIWQFYLLKNISKIRQKMIDLFFLHDPVCNILFSWCICLPLNTSHIIRLVRNIQDAFSKYLKCMYYGTII